MVNPEDGPLEVKEEEVVRRLAERESTGVVTRAALKTDERVLARITDGIYRHPSSAIRELIANAYDADATEVVVRTDPPRFGKISVRDDGRGMDRETLARMIFHIGGSAKRTSRGSELGLVNEADPSLSPNGRKLIGKIGIGLFSVAQLTRHFRIITKQRGMTHRLVADVRLHTYSEDDLATRKPGVNEVMTGIVHIRSVKALDVETQGTEVILERVQSSAVELLRSSQLWLRVDENDEDLPSVASPPAYHCGRATDDSGQTVYVVEPSLPWRVDDGPRERAKALHQALFTEFYKRTTKPTLAHSLDEYLRTIWNLGLALPVDYVDGIHPFDLSGAALPRIFRLSNDAKGQAKELPLSPHETVREHLDLSAPNRSHGDRFEVFFDGVQVLRPIVFSGLPEAERDDDKVRPLLFVGSFFAEFGSLSASVIGGSAFEFEAYLLWTPRVVPTEHAGVMIRIADASGTLFDETFLGYQIQELRRLSQITGEVFVRVGLDAALNIDRESFNFGHPHAKILAAWVHRAMRQVATTQKKIAKAHRDVERAKDLAENLSEVQRLVADQVNKVAGRKPSRVAVVDGQPGGSRLSDSRGTVFVSQRTIEPALPKSTGPAQRLKREVQKERVVGIIQLLDAFGVLEELTFDEREQLFGAIAQVLGAGE